MSVRFRLVNMLESGASGTGCRRSARSRGRGARPPRRTASRRPRRPCPSRIGSSSLGYSCGSYSRSASWMMTMSPVTAANPVRRAAPLPRLRSCRTRRHRPAAASSRKASPVPSVEQSSTTTISFSRGTAFTRERISRIVPISLYAGMTTDSFILHLGGSSEIPSSRFGFSFGLSSGPASPSPFFRIRAPPCPAGDPPPVR